MRDFSKLMLGLLLLVSGLMISCKDQFADVNSPDREPEESLRMPFNEHVFFLDSRNGWSYIYKVKYDFQGLTGNATLTPFAKVKGGSHMAVSPASLDPVDGKRYVTVVNNGGQGLIHFFGMDYNMETGEGEHYTLGLYSAETGEKGVKLTQVDFDQNDFLFVAGKSGKSSCFYRISVDRSETKNNNIITEAKDASVSKVWAHKLTVQDGEFLAVDEEDEDPAYVEYMDEDQGSYIKNPIFKGGDILFTQNADETDGFEHEVLISFTQAHGGAAMLVDLKFGDVPSGEYENAISLNARKMFRLQDARGNEEGKHSFGAGKVTGAALVGDNYVITSNHKKKEFLVYSISGNGVALANPTIQWPSTVPAGWAVPSDSRHNWGDMASAQVFDINSENGDGLNSREIDGPDSYRAYWDYKEMKGVATHQYAEVKLYRRAEYDPEISEIDEGDSFSDYKESRNNSANADIADFRKKAQKFVTLGGNSGMLLMRLPKPMNVTESSFLQVVETSWNKKHSYPTVDKAHSAYPEKAKVYILPNEDTKYYEFGLESKNGWVCVGDVGIANNELSLLNYVGDSFAWIKIVDFTEDSDSDGYDVNFVSAFDRCGCEISEVDFDFRYDEDTKEIVLNWNIDVDELKIAENGGLQLWFKNGRQYDDNRDQIGIFLTKDQIISGEQRVNIADFNYSGADCIQDISFSVHVVCNRTAEGWTRGNVFSLSEKLTGIEYCQQAERQDDGQESGV